MAPKHEKKGGGGGEVDPNDPDAFVYSTDPAVSEIQRKAAGVFEVFDMTNQKVVDVREVGTMSRALDLYPSEAEVHEIIGGVEEPKGYVKLANFINHMTKVIQEGRYKPVPQADLLNAMKALDTEKKGIMDPARFRDIMTKEGEPFTVEEADELYNFSVNKNTNMVHVEEYVDKLFRVLHLV